MKQENIIVDPFMKCYILGVSPGKTWFERLICYIWVYQHCFNTNEHFGSSRVSKMVKIQMVRLAPSETWYWAYLPQPWGKQAQIFFFTFLLLYRYILIFSIITLRHNVAKELLYRMELSKWSLVTQFSSHIEKKKKWAYQPRSPLLQ